MSQGHFRISAGINGYVSCHISGLVGLLMDCGRVGLELGYIISMFLATTKVFRLII